MTYSGLEIAIQQIAQQFLLEEGVGHFHCGNDVTLEQAVKEHGYPVIYLEELTGERDFERNSITPNVTLGFFEKGAHDLSADEKRIIYARQEDVSARFLVMLHDSDEIQFSKVRDAKVPHFTEQDLIGIGSSFTITSYLTVCS